MTHTDSLEALAYQSIESTDPLAMARKARAAKSTPIRRNILALDLGTKCGYACRNMDGVIVYGTEVFTPKKHWSAGQRWQRFRGWLVELVVNNHIHCIAYEEVRRHNGNDAAHVYGAFLALTQLIADSHNLELVPVGVGAIKKHWTGKGNALKDAMIKEAKSRGFHPKDDNCADALAILDWATAQERKHEKAHAST